MDVTCYEIDYQNHHQPKTIDQDLRNFLESVGLRSILKSGGVNLKNKPRFLVYFATKIIILW